MLKNSTENIMGIVTSLQLGRKIVSIMGPEGSGKTTIARRLVAETGKPYVNVGDILREMAKSDMSIFGDECRAMFNENRYLNSQMLFNILAHRFGKDDLANGFIVDGGMRKVEEVHGFKNVLDTSDRKMPVSVVQLRIPGWMSFQRLTLGEDARKRSDDTVSGVQKRLSNYYNQLGTRARLIREQADWRLLCINAMGTPERTFTNVKTALDLPF